MGLAFVSFVLPFLFSIYTPPPQVEYATYAHWPVTDLSIVTLACTCPDIMYMNHPCICNQSDLRHHILARIGNWEWSLMVTSESSTELGKTGFTIVKKFHSKFYCNWQRQEKNFAKQSRSWNLSAHSQSCGSTGKISSNWSGLTMQWSSSSQLIVATSFIRFYTLFITVLASPPPPPQGVPDQGAKIYFISFYMF